MEDIEAIAVLQDPVRRRLYEYVVAQRGEVSRSDAAEAVGVQRTLAAFHLDKLVDAGLLETESRRLGGQSGPGAGRPAKLYRRSGAELQFSVPERDYRTAADLLAEVAEVARLDTALQAAARREGRAAAQPVGDLSAAAAVLAGRGYEPRPDGDVLRLANCPFQVLSQRHPGLVCGMNLALLEGLLDGAPGLRARMDPRPGLCCVAVEHSKNNDH
ncbi:helix-turn-helix transcriptional regulator [Amycolatopsis benzoatilytica]|uniref:helix-turn-helix transcriptional regulator n=1 Tax=Amycolatopsis benzoatilytica TaxID=346045 RepID=UPI00036FDCEA|nr:helix-turn-helix domain-containing protein [Amycolatopsis benzoatilytica]